MVCSGVKITTFDILLLHAPKKCVNILSMFSTLTTVTAVTYPTLVRSKCAETRANFAHLGRAELKQH